MESWANFFVAAAGAAAALAGLLFVAISVNLGRILQYPGLPLRAAESLGVLLLALLLSLLALVPGESVRVFGAAVTALALGGWIALTMALARGSRPQRRPLLRVLMNQLPTVMLVIAGVALFSGHPDGLYLLVYALLLAFAAGVLGAWVLLIEILR